VCFCLAANFMTHRWKRVFVCEIKNARKWTDWNSLAIMPDLQPLIANQSCTFSARIRPFFWLRSREESEVAWNGLLKGDSSSYRSASHACVSQNLQEASSYWSIHVAGSLVKFINCKFASLLSEWLNFHHDVTSHSPRHIKCVASSRNPFLSHPNRTVWLVILSEWEERWDNWHLLTVCESLPWLWESLKNENLISLFLIKFINTFIPNRFFFKVSTPSRKNLWNLFGCCCCCCCYCCCLLFVVRC
jgi:hypothetical protein